MHNDSADSPEAEVQRLLEERGTIQGWIGRLEERSEGVSEKIVQRVSADYQDRLHSVLEALSAHQRALRDRIEEAERNLAGAEARRAAAMDDFEEARLRTTIGEIEEWAWKEREPVLQNALNEANDTREQALGDVERLVEILSQLDDRDESSDAFGGTDELDAGAVEAAEESTEGSAEEGMDGQGALALGAAAARIEIGRVVLAELEAEEREEAVVELAAGGENRATSPDGSQIEVDAESTAATATDDEADEDVDTSPKPGIKCAECGYTNDVSAWFCGVCGADIG
jgi:hypothetical protein